MNRSPSIRRRVLRNLSSLIIVRGLNLITPIVALPYLLRVIGMENYGYIAFATVIATFAGSIISYGFSITGVKAVAAARGDPALLTQVFWRNLSASLLIGAAICVAHTATIFSIPGFRDTAMVHLGAMLLAAGNAMFPHWLFLGLERSYLVAFSTLISRVSYLVLLVLFVNNPEDYVLVNFLGAASAWASFTVSIGLSIGIFGLKPHRAKGREIIETIREGFPSFLLQWSPNLYNSVASIILGFYVSPISFGAFNVAQAVATLVISIGQLMANAFLPILSINFDRHRTSVQALLISGGILAVSMFGFAPLTAMLLADSNHDEIVRDLRYLALSIPFAFGYFAFGHNYVALTASRSQAGLITVLISLFGLALSVIIVPAFESAGVAAVLFLSRMAMCAMAYILYRRSRRLIGT